MKNKILYQLLFGGMVVFLSSCSEHSDMTKLKSSEAAAAPKATVNNESEAMISFPSMVQQDIGKVHFNASVLGPKSTDLKGCTAVPKSLNSELIYSQLFNGVTVTNHQELDIRNDDGTTGKADYYNGEEKESLSITEHSISYYQNLAFYVMNTFHLEKGQQDYNADLYQKNTDFSFLSRKDALNKIIKELTALGINLDGNLIANCYPLDYETMKKEEYAIDQNGTLDRPSYKESWSSDDNCYYFCIRQSAEDLPVSYKYADTFNKIEDGNSPIQILISKNGIEMLRIDKIFEISYTGTVKLSDIDSIVKSISDKYNELLTTSSYTVNKLELQEICIKGPGGKYTVRPSWVAEIYEYPDSQNVSEYYQLQMIIDGQNAKEIIL